MKHSQEVLSHQGVVSAETAVAQRNLANHIMRGQDVLVSIIRGPTFEEMEKSYLRGEPVFFWIMSSAAAATTGSDLIASCRDALAAKKTPAFVDILKIAVRFDGPEDVVRESLAQEEIPRGKAVILSPMLDAGQAKWFQVLPGSLGTHSYDPGKKGTLGELYFSGRNGPAHIVH